MSTVSLKISRKRIRMHRPSFSRVMLYIFLCLMVVVCALPLFAMVCRALMPLDELYLYPPRLIVQKPTLRNFSDLLTSLSSSTVPFTRYIFNSLFTTVATVLASILVCCLGAYGLVKHRPAGSNIIFGIVVAFDQNSSIFQVVSYAWAGLGASFGPLMLTSLYWRRTNKYGAIAGMLSGTATVLIWHNLVKPLGGIFAIYELLPAFIVSLLFIVVISLLTPAPSAEVLHEFDHYLDDPDDRHVDDDLVAAEIAAGEKRSQI